MARLTVVDVRMAFSRYADVLARMGVDVSSLELQEASGSQKYRVTLNGHAAPGTSEQAFAWGHIGGTAREAVHTLLTASRALEFAHTYFTNPE